MSSESEIKNAAVGKSTLAYVLGLSVNTIGKHLNHADAPKPDGKKYPLALTVQYIIDRRNQDNAVRGAAARERKDKADARIKEHQAALLEGEVIPKQTLYKLWYAAHDLVASELKKIPRKVANWKKEQSAAEVQKYVSGLIREAMSHLETGLDKLGEEL